MEFLEIIKEILLIIIYILTIFFVFVLLWKNRKIKGNEKKFGHIEDDFYEMNISPDQTEYEIKKKDLRLLEEEIKKQKEEIERLKFWK